MRVVGEGARGRGYEMMVKYYSDYLDIRVAELQLKYITSISFA